MHLALGEHLVGSPVGRGAAAGRVVLVQLAVAQRHGSMGVGVAVDVVDQHVALVAAVVACGLETNEVRMKKGSSNG